MRDWLIDPVAAATWPVVVDREGLDRVLPQRHEFALLDALTLIDREHMLAVGYLDTKPDDFWVRGHIPGRPLMPGVLLCEAAAQVCASARQFLEDPYPGFVGFGGITEARFRAPVLPGSRLVIAAQVEKKHRVQWLWKCQGFVGDKLHFNVGIIGVHM